MTLVLSRYACVRGDGDGGLVAEGAAGDAVALDAPALALLAAFGSPREVAAAAEEAGLATADAERIAAALVDARVLVAPAGEQDAHWAFHDRLFHARTRSGRLLRPSPPRMPPPALVERPWAPVVELPRPDLDALEREDPPFARVQAERASRRVHRAEPLALGRLGELLFRVGRVDDLWRMGVVEYASRPYPAGGALHELELYLAVRACEGVEPGLWHYAAAHHRLARVAPDGPDVDRLLSTSAAAMAVADRPQVLVIAAARYERLAWKYGGLAYTLVLKHVGVLMQTLYLATTAMGLAGCAIGTGNAEVFARASGLPPDEECSVGEFALGEPA
jgi:SagB-type dehydrogenase family enzyme